MCLYPKVIRNKKYTMTKKNGGNVPPVKDERVKYVPVGCGQCMECRKQKAREWQVRMLEDIKHNRNGKFVTLTFSNESITSLTHEIWGRSITRLEGYLLDNAIATMAVRRFLERWRKKYKKSLRHWLVTELGGNGTENVHLHGIVWTDKPEEVERIWEYGWVWRGTRKEGKGGIIEYENYVNDRTVNYIIKYVTKMDEKHKLYKPAILTSPGIGRDYTNTWNSKQNQYNEDKTNETYRTGQGAKIALPIYYRNKIYTEEQRENLWLNKLDKQVRWVVGEKIDVSGGEEVYYQVLDYYRKLNKELGYGDDEKTWEREQYERERRILMQRKRIDERSESPQAGGAGNSKDIETQDIKGQVYEGAKEPRRTNYDMVKDSIMSIAQKLKIEGKIK